jgi:hypothetical protein
MTGLFSFTNPSLNGQQGQPTSVPAMQSMQVQPPPATPMPNFQALRNANFGSPQPTGGINPPPMGQQAGPTQQALAAGLAQQQGQNNPFQGLPAANAPLLNNQTMSQ